METVEPIPTEEMEMVEPIPTEEEVITQVRHLVVIGPLESVSFKIKVSGSE